MHCRVQILASCYGDAGLKVGRRVRCARRICRRSRGNPSASGGRAAPFVLGAQERDRTGDHHDNGADPDDQAGVPGVVRLRYGGNACRRGVLDDDQIGRGRRSARDLDRWSWVGRLGGSVCGNLNPIGLTLHAFLDDGEVDRVITRFTSLLEPIMILVMGVLVFFIVVAILLPIFEMGQMVR